MQREEQLIKAYITDKTNDCRLLKEEIEKITYEEIGKYIGYKELSCDVNKILDTKNEIIKSNNLDKILESSLLLVKSIDNVHLLKEKVIDKNQNLKEDQYDDKRSLDQIKLLKNGRYDFSEENNFKKASDILKQKGFTVINRDVRGVIYRNKETNQRAISKGSIYGGGKIIITEQINEKSVVNIDKKKISNLIDNYYRKYLNTSKVYNRIAQELHIQPWQVSDIDKEFSITNDIEEELNESISKLKKQIKKIINEN